MAEEKEKKTEKELKTAKDASIDFPVLVVATEADPYHETEHKFHAGKKKADELVKRGWVKMAMIALLAVMSFAINAQTSVVAPLYNATNTYTLARLQAATAVRDTVTNTGLGALYSKRTAGPGIVTIQVDVVKVSGTVAGTLTLYGSIDGLTYTALNTEETQTALATKALADATATYNWRLKNSPFLYYYVGTAGGTTTVYYLNAKILKH